MSSFNIKCFSSGQVIAAGERCRIAVILQQSTPHPAQVVFRGQQYPVHGIRNYGRGTDMHWAPLTAFMSGTYGVDETLPRATYRDTAIVTLDANEENRVVLAEFFMRLYHQAGKTLDSRGRAAFDFKGLVEQHAPRLHAQLVDRPQSFERVASELDMNEALTVWNAFQRAVNHDRVFCVNSLEVLRPVKTAVLHEVAFQRLIELAEKDKTPRGDSLERNAHFTRALLTLREDLCGVDSPMRRTGLKFSFFEGLEMQMPNTEVDPLLNVFHRWFERAADAVSEEGQPVSHFLDACRGPLDGLYALLGLNILEVAYVPVTFAGLDDHNVIGQRYADFVAGCAQEISDSRKVER
jgi:hypothetical protein